MLLLLLLLLGGGDVATARLEEEREGAAATSPPGALKHAAPAGPLPPAEKEVLVPRNKKFWHPDPETT